jgi:hypothetical protein
MTRERLTDVPSRPRERKIPDVGFVCVGRFLDSLPAQMIAYRLS